MTLPVSGLVLPSHEKWAKPFTAAINGYTPGDGPSRAPYHAAGLISLLDSWGALRLPARILDVGCGNAPLAILAAENPMSVLYMGVEPVWKCVEFARDTFADHMNVVIGHRDIRNGMYNPKGKMDSDEYRFPVVAKGWTLIVLNSVFTHMGTIARCRHYLDEAARTIADRRGSVYVTWFVAPPNAQTEDEGRTVFDEAAVRECIHAAGFKVVHEKDGLTSEMHDQRKMLLEKR